MPVTPSHHDVRVAGVRTHFATAGRGDPLVLVHGAEIGTSGAYAWRHNLADLAAHFTVYALDRIGFGASEKPAIEYTDRVMADHLAGFVDALCLERVSMVGNSMGGYGVARYAVDHPERVRKMAMIGSGTVASAMDISYTPGPGPGAMARVVERPTAADVAALMEVLFESRAEVDQHFIAERLRWITMDGAQDAMRSLHAYRDRMNADPDLRQRFLLKHRLPMLTIPAILIWGKKDAFASADVAVALQRQLPNLRGFFLMEHSGHQAQHDEVASFNRILIDFLKAPE